MGCDQQPRHGRPRSLTRRTEPCAGSIPAASIRCPYYINASAQRPVFLRIKAGIVCDDRFGGSIGGAHCLAEVMTDAVAVEPGPQLLCAAGRP